MVFYLDRLECLIERWQSRRKTVEISQIAAKSNKRQQKRENQKKPAAVENRPTRVRVNNYGDNNNKNTNNNSNNYGNNQVKQQHAPSSSSSSSHHQMQSTTNKGKATTLIEPSAQMEATGSEPLARDSMNSEPLSYIGGTSGLDQVGAFDDDKTCSAVVRETQPGAGGPTGCSDSKTTKQTSASITPITSNMMLIKHHHHHPTQKPQTLNATNLIPVLSVLVILVGLLNHCQLIQLTMASSSGSSSGGSNSLAPAISSMVAPSAAPLASAVATTAIGSARQLGQRLHLSNMIQQLANAPPSTRSRWIQIPGPPSSIRDPPGTRHQTYLGRAVSRLRNRIGARNTIRVHNAFRDFAWRLLASMNMPTPVIYELRRQHLYSPEDDSMNDSLFNRNTSKTVRSKRQLLKYLPDMERRWIQGDGVGGLSMFKPRARDDDDDEKESLAERVRSRFEELASISSRSLFGRVIRVPSLFPFKRQEDSDDTRLTGKDGRGTGGGGGGRRARRRRRKKESDRQMININGKQYYVNDDGELKELNEKSEE